MNSKRLFAMLLALCLLAGLLTLPAAAEDAVASGECGEGLTWTLDAAGTLTISGTGPMEPYYYYDEVPWTEYRGEIKKLVLGEGITEIAEEAFRDCTALTEVTIPAGVTKLGDMAFLTCSSLKKVTFPEGLEEIGEQTFQECAALETAELPESLVVLGEQAFCDCAALKSIAIGPLVETIGNMCFNGATALECITVSAANEHYCELDGILYTKDHKQLICCPAALAVGSYTVPEGTETIIQGAFQECAGLTAVTFPSTLRTIENHTFRKTALRTVTIPTGVTTIGSAAFSACPQLTEIRVEAGSESFRSVGGCLFSADGKKMLQYPAGKSGSSYAVPTGVTELDVQTFFGCVNLESVTLPEGLTSFGTYTFADAPLLKNVTFPDSIETVGSDAFRNTPLLLDEANWKDGLLYMGPVLVAVRKEELGSELTVKAGTRAIANRAFAECGTLTKVVLPAGLRAIPDYCFNHCAALEDVNIPSAVTRIGRYAFSHCDALESFDIPGNVTSIGDLAFSVSDGLKNVTVRGDLTGIGRNAFINCRTLETVTFCGTVGTIGERVFSGCRSLKTLTIGGVTAIGENAFANCVALTDVYFGGSEEAWNAVEIGEGNVPLTKAAIHFGTQPPVQQDVPGDVSGNGTVDAGDVLAIFAAVSSSAANGLPRADVSGEGKINNKDAILAFRTAWDR